jgi:hypothetical protein
MDKRITDHIMDELNLEEKMTDLRANSMSVCQLVDPQVVSSLSRASELSCTAVPASDNLDSQEVSDDPAVLCGMVRSLAINTYRVLRQASNGISDGLLHEIGELRDRVDQLQRTIHMVRDQRNCNFEDVQRWLDSLRRRVEGLLAQPQRESQK